MRKIISLLVVLLFVLSCSFVLAACDVNKLDYESRIAELESKIISVDGKNSESSISNMTSSDGVKDSDSTEFNEGLDYHFLSDKTYGVSCGTANYLSKIVIPRTHNGKVVTQIVDNGFYGCERLTEITIPDSITSIGSSAFSGCKQLKSMNIPEGVVRIGEMAFSDCYALTNVTIPCSVASIGRSAFRSCNRLNYNIYDNAYYLGNENNPYCSLIKAYPKSTCTIFPNTKVIEDYAFEQCINLTKLIIPDSITDIGKYAFLGCCKLVEICNDSALTVNIGSEDHGYVGYYAKNIYSSVSGESKLSIIDDCIIYTDGKEKILISYIGSQADVVLSEDITEIYSEALYGRINLRSITIPDSVTSIGEMSFYNCDSLREVKIGSGIERIGCYAFDSCDNLSSVTFKSTIGWQIDGESVSVTNAAQNATYLNKIYCENTWIRK